MLFLAFSVYFKVAAVVYEGIFWLHNFHLVSIYSFLELCLSKHKSNVICQKIVKMRSEHVDVFVFLVGFFFFSPHCRDVELCSCSNSAPNVGTRALLFFGDRSFFIVAPGVQLCVPFLTRGRLQSGEH